MKEQLQELLTHCDDLDALLRKLDGLHSFFEIIAAHYAEYGSVPNTDTVRRLTGMTDDLLLELVRDLRGLSFRLNDTRTRLNTIAVTQ